MDNAVVKEKLRLGHFFLVANSGKSRVWQDIGVVAEKDTNGIVNRKPFVACKKCLKCFNYKSHITGTSNLSRHISRCNQAASSSAKRLLKQQVKKVRVSKKSKLKVLDATTELVVRDLQPFTAIEDNGMKRFAQALIDTGAHYGNINICDVLPSRQQIHNHIKTIATKEKLSLAEKVQQAIAANGGISATTDLWTDSYRQQSYISCTVHWIDNAVLHHSTLFCKILRSGWNTAENIHNEIVSNLGQLGIDEEMLRKITFVTDGEANIKKAFDMFSWLPCCGHILNTILYHGFKIKPEPEDNPCDIDGTPEGDESIDCVVKLLVAVNDLVSYLKRSGLSSQLSTTGLQEVETQCNSKLAVPVLVSVHKEFQEIELLLANCNESQRLESIDIVLMEDVIKFLTPFTVISDAMEGDKYPTIHGVLLWKKKLQDHCKFDISDSRIIKALKAKIAALIDEKWPDLDLYKVALFLFPKFKSLSILPPSKAKEVSDRVREMLQESRFHCNKYQASNNDHSDLAPKKSKFSYALEFNDYADTPGHEASDEIRRYINANFSFNKYNADDHIASFDVLKFWSEQKSAFPRLAKLARYIFAIPCSSSSSERVFSCAGGVYDEHWSGVHPETIEAIVFLNSYWRTK